MSSQWNYTRTVGIGGRFEIEFCRPNYPPTIVTYFRGVPTQLGSYSAADPFGDSVASITFPQLSGYDELAAGDVDPWLADGSDVNIWYLPGQLASSQPTLSGAYVADATRYIDPLNQQTDVVAPFWNYTVVGGTAKPTSLNAIKVWEGFVASIGVSSDQNASSLTVQCQGALFQVDGHMAKPFFPPRPQPLESLIAALFDHRYFPELRTAPLQIAWPTGWTKVAPPLPKGGATLYTPQVTPGARWSGYASRTTGSWEHALTGFIQAQLGQMITTTDSGVTPGNQWTLMLAHEGDAAYPVGRTPVLQVRDTTRPPDITVWYGAPGVACNLNRDFTQTAQLIYGTGTSIDGTQWDNAVVASDGSRTDYVPLAASTDVYPLEQNAFHSSAAVARETYLQFGTGFDAADGKTVAQTRLSRLEDPGWSGTITLSVDPIAGAPAWVVPDGSGNVPAATSTSRWMIRPGMTIALSGFMGSGVAGKNFHIASVEASPQSGTVTLTVDTLYRDLLTLTEALDRTRDPLTPQKLLKAGTSSQLIEDVLAPWNYTAGSGFIPGASTAFFAHKPVTSIFPYTDWTRTYPPSRYPHYYVKIPCNASTRAKRWAGPIPVRMSEKGTIRRSEFLIVDQNGNPFDAGFHVSLYYTKVNYTFMPEDKNGPDPFIFGAFSQVNPLTGLPWSNFAAMGGVADSLIIGWGQYQQAAGYWPGLQSLGSPATGLLVDESTWTFDCTNNPNFNKNANPGQTQPLSSITVYAMAYIEPHVNAAYLIGRLYHQEPGTT